MQRTPALAFMLIAAAMTLSGCQVIGGILKAGIWMGVIFAVVVIAIIFWLFRKFSNRS